MTDLFIKQKGNKMAKRIRYDYLNEDGSLTYYKERMECADGSKSFIFYKPDGTKGAQGIL